MPIEGSLGYAEQQPISHSGRPGPDRQSACHQAQRYRPSSVSSRCRLWTVLCAVALLPHRRSSDAIARAAQAKSYPARDRRIPQSPLVKQNLLVKSLRGSRRYYCDAQRFMMPVAAFFHLLPRPLPAATCGHRCGSGLNRSGMPGKARKVQANSGKLRWWASIDPALRFRGERRGRALRDCRSRAREPSGFSLLDR